MTKDWITWHAEYDDPSSPLSQRRGHVTAMIRKSLDEASPGSIRCLSLCAGNAGDLTDALSGHRRRADVSGSVVELDPRLARQAAANIESAGADLQVLIGDAGDPLVFGDALPVDLLLLVGIFGNISDSDIQQTIRAVPAMCREGATVIWTRHRREPDLTPSIRRWFDAAGCVPVDFVSPGVGSFSVGRERVVHAASRELIPAQLFAFGEDEPSQSCGER